MYTCKTCGADMYLLTMATKYKCKECHNNYMSEYRDKNREKVRSYGRAYMRMARDYSDVPNLRAINGKLHIYYQGEKLA